MAADGSKPALISVRQTTAESKWAGSTCPKCSKPIQPGEQAVLCPKCYTPQHRDCWADNGNKCAVDGTPANVLHRGAWPAAGAARPSTAPAAGDGTPAPAHVTSTEGAAATAEPPPVISAPAAPAADLAATGELSQPAAVTASSPAVRAEAAVTQTTGGPTTGGTSRPARPPAPAPAGGRANGAGRPAPARPATPAAPGAQVSRTAQRSAARRSQAQLTTWPHLLMPEFISSVLLIIGLTVMAWFINAPLEEHSNPNRTPNPSKAPWYFLNLQELLLHMHPALAGVIIPTLAVVLLMAIPYLDINSDETGVWFSGARGRRVFWISAIYTTVMNLALIMIDKVIGIRASVETALPFLKTAWLSEIVTQTMVPTAIIWAVSVGLYLIIAPTRPTVREVMIAYFTAFAVTWVLLAIIGSAFRGQGMELFWPWDRGMNRIG